ncbi:hypothetical protein LSTR_LSTR003980 [Laodelphax striatellus]|uniref:Uncharacterized protein n=1 Tax=Laodelphax striatellus TaxID=195883 RepID=A0A482WF64_LAOST|nr:hypothetical protein LSTR_LSTR003980 [Laodelphax striatellus]
MKYILGIFLTLWFINSIKSDCANPKVDTVNVKTVLWGPMDTYKVCWSKSEELLLYARRVAQDLLPKKIPKDLSQTIHYLEIIWEAIQKFSPKLSSSKEILRPAVADVLGGYLQSIALPMVNEGYYAGDVDYAVVKAFYDLFHRVKAYLDTDGRGWHKPCDMKDIPTRVSSFDYHLIPQESDRYACDELHLPEKSEPCEETTACAKLDALPEGRNELPKKIALPFLDDENEPTSVVLPFREQYLYSLTSPSSAHVLARYYNLAMRCIGKADQETMQAFNHAFYNWIVTYVAPHLHTPTQCHMETEWYPGFGSVMRILETMHQHGLTPGESRGRNYGIIHDGAVQRYGHHRSGAAFHGFGKAITDIGTGEGSGRFSVDRIVDWTHIKSLPYLGEIVEYDPILSLLGFLIILAILIFCLRNFCNVCNADGKKRGMCSSVCSGRSGRKPLISLYYKYLKKMVDNSNAANSKSTVSASTVKSRSPEDPDDQSRPSAIVNSEQVMSSSMLEGTSSSSRASIASSTPDTSRKKPSKRRKSTKKDRRSIIRKDEKSRKGKRPVI